MTAANDCSALEWYRRAAAQHHAKATTSLGWIYFMADCVERNTGATGRLFKRAFELGDGDAAFDMFLYYWAPKSEQFNLKLGAYWLKKAWEMRPSDGESDPDALENARQAATYLVYAYRYGIGVDRDLKLAEHHVRMVAQQGSRSGQRQLGEFLLENDPASIREAWKWIFLAAYQAEFYATRLVAERAGELSEPVTTMAREEATALFDEMVKNPSNDLGKAAIWCREHEPGSRQCLRYAYVDHAGCNPHITFGYFEQRYVSSMAYSDCRRKSYDAR